MKNRSAASRFANVLARATALPREWKRAISVVLDLVFIPVALFLALLINDGSVAAARGYSTVFFASAALSSVALFAALGLYRAVLRFMAPTVAFIVLAGVTGSALTIAVLDMVVTGTPISWSAITIYWMLGVLYLGGSRLFARYCILRLQGNGSRERVAIYGAGEAGSQLSAALALGRNFLPVAFVDDNKSLIGSSIGGVSVFSSDGLEDVVRQRRIRRVLLAMPSSSPGRRRDVLTSLEAVGVRVQTVPDFADILSGRARVDDLRDIDPADLIARDPVAPNDALLDACIKAKSVMVTGAGGSIGSELCRQIAQLAPSTLVLFEMSEVALYTIEQEVRQLATRGGYKFRIVALLGNAHHEDRVREVMQAFGVQTVYHAAAYKHVPIVEQNVIEGVHNNIIATWHTAQAAMDSGVESFVLISTDKAVNPTNVMGATKRFAELVLQGLQARSSGTRFSMVRFGNVLASSGSVVPLFEKQIRAGGPVTVTHPEARRYFMTIPEAAQLVIQTGSMAKGGDVFVLDMGDPIKIVDLAARLIHLHGLTIKSDQNPDGDIEILHTGLRPAEKLYEELLIGNAVTGTEHPMIMRAMEHSLPWERVRAYIDELLAAANVFDCRVAIDVLTRSVREYRSANEVVDIVWSETHRQAGPAKAAAERVTDLAARRRAN